MLPKSNFVLEFYTTLTGLLHFYIQFKEKQKNLLSMRAVTCNLNFMGTRNVNLPMKNDD